MVDVHRANRFGGMGGLILERRDLILGTQKRTQNGTVFGTKVWSYDALAEPKESPFLAPKRGPENWRYCNFVPDVIVNQAQPAATIGFAIHAVVVLCGRVIACSC